MKFITPPNIKIKAKQILKKLQKNSLMLLLIKIIKKSKTIMGKIIEALH
jgi:hypothetical protein